MYVDQHWWFLGSNHKMVDIGLIGYMKRSIHITMSYGCLRNLELSFIPGSERGRSRPRLGQAYDLYQWPLQILEDFPDTFLRAAVLSMTTMAIMLSTILIVSVYGQKALLPLFEKTATCTSWKTSSPVFVETNHGASLQEWCFVRWVA